MMRKWLFATVMLMLLPGAVMALGLGKLDLDSSLNEPFEARIPLLSASVDELDSLKVGLASPEAFERAGLQFGFGLEQLKFEIQQPESGNDYIRIYSTNAIREPFLNFLLEVNWSQGRLYREYTVLLDPPTYDPGRKMAEMAPVPQPTTGSFAPGTAIEDNQVTYNLDYDSPATSRAVRYDGGDYGPVGAGDTLWSIASTMRPDSSVSVQQMMLALLRANPEAFINNNINGLKRGRILSMPGSADMAAVSKREAIELAKSQNDLWNDIRAGMADAATARPESAGVSGAAPESLTTDETLAGDDAELRLVAPDDSGEGIDEAKTEAGADPETERLMSLANETISALQLENSELQDRLLESESIIEDLKRLIQLKEDELAALQNQVAMADAGEDAIPDESAMEDEVAAIDEDTGAAGDEAESTTEAMDTATVEDDAVDDETMAADTSTPVDAGIMGMVNQYLGPVIEIVKSNLIAVAGAIGGIVVLLLGFLLYQKHKSGTAETMDIPEADFPDFEDVTDAATAAGTAGMLDVADSEAATEIPEDEEQEDKTPTPEIPEAAETDDATQIAAPPAEAVPAQEEEDDPLAEVNVFLAYEHYDQAEEFVKTAIEGDPENLEFHSKLLEVYYAAGNRKSYEEEARVLHGLVNGEGSHWDMAVAMWSELSPNRALFEEGPEDEDEIPVETGGGIVDLTAGEEPAAEEEDKDAGLDFDIGADDEDEGILDVTSAGEEAAEKPAEDEDEILDVTAAAGDSDSELLDVTAAVGLDDTTGGESGRDEENMLDITGGGEDDEVLDITAGTDQAGVDSSIRDSDKDDSGDDDVLDITANADQSTENTTAENADEEFLDLSQPGGDDLLDVTASANMTPDDDEDLLDVTSASTSGADSDSLLDVDTGETDSGRDDDDNSLDFDMEGLDLDISDDRGGDDSDAGSMIEKSMASDDDDNVIDFENLDLETEDTGDNDIEGTVEVDATTLGIDTSDEDGSDTGTPEVELDLTMDMEESDKTAAEDSTGDFSLDLDVPESDSDTADANELSIDDSGDDSGFSLDLDADDASGEKDTPEFELDIDSDDTESTSEEFDLDLEIQDEPESEPEQPSAGDAVPDIDMESTVEIPKNRLELVDEGDDEDDDKTVFVPKSSGMQEQSQEDEISTKLDLAKAYVELGDSDSARTILQEIMNEGTEEQQQQAQELLNQV